MLLSFRPLRCAATATTLALVLCSARARSASLSWQAPAGCPTEAEVVQRLESARGGRLADAAPITFSAEVSETAPGRLTLTVRTHDPRAGPSAQTRTLAGSHCEELVSALVQVVSLVLGPAPPTSETDAETAEDDVAAVDAPPEAETSNVPEAPAPPDQVRGVPDTSFAPSSAGPAPLRESARLGLLAVLDTASFGTAALGAQLEATWNLSSWLELRGAIGYVPAHRLDAASGDGEHARFSLALSAVLGCGVWRSGGWRLPVCAGMETGEWRASGGGVSRSASEDVLWLALRADARLGVEIVPRLHANLLAGFAVPLQRHEFFVDGARIHRLPALAPRAGLGLEYGF